MLRGRLSRPRLAAIAAVALGLAVWGSDRAVAQDANATITGSVADEQGQMLPGATITLINENTKTARTTVSDARGEFRVPTLVPATYTVKVELQGFKTFESRGNVLSAASTLSMGAVKLGLGSLTELIVVEESGTKVNAEESQHSGLLTSNQIEQIQSKGRDVMNLLRALPGVRYMDDLDAAGDSFGSEVPNVGGQRQEWNRVTVDGLNANELSGSRRVASAVNLDSLAEVKVLLNTYKAEFGGTGGANIQIITKGGGTEYRGNLYWYGRRTNWNANRWQNNRTLSVPGDPSSALPRPIYDFNTFGFNVGGPAPFQGSEKKFFLFYSLESPNVKRPGPLRLYQMPTEAERRGDFSQSYVYGNPSQKVTIVDPITGQPFPNNIVPADRIDKNMQALMNMYPTPNRLDLNETKGNYNFVRQETSRNPRQNHQLRLDWKPSERDSLFLSTGVQKSYQAGSEITVGPSKWGFFDGFYDFGDYRASLGYTRIFNASVINEFSAGFRTQDEGFGADDPAEQAARLDRTNVGFNAGQFYPELNKPNLIPRIQVDNINATGVERPDFTFDNRFGYTAHDYVFSIRDNITYTRSGHTYKAGLMLERVNNNEAPGGDWMGRYVFGNSNRATGNPLAAGSTYANMLMGVYNSYNEIDNYRNTMVRQNRVEGYVQDTWKVNRRLTADLGLRLLWYTPYRQANGQTSAFVFERYDPANAPRMYVPAPGNTARDLATGQVVPGALAGTYVPGTGDRANGMVPAYDRTYPYGFRDNQGIHPEPRIGIAYDLFGNGKTGLHFSAGLFHQGYVGGGVGGNLQGPPTSNETNIPNSLVSQVLASGKVYRPGDVRGLERDAKTPAAYSLSLGIQQEIGLGMVVDATYVGSVNRHLEMQVNYNEIPVGARLPGQNINPLTNARYPDVFLRPYLGHNDINVNENWGTANYNALQLQLNRRYIKGLQFSLAYTWSKALGLGGNDNAYAISLDFLEHEYAPLPYNQAHNFVANFTYDAPKVSKVLGDIAPVRFLLDNWQFSGEYAYASGDWAGITLATSPTDFQISGGTATARPIMTKDPRNKGGSPFDPDNPWFDTTAFALPEQGQLGNTPARVIQRPPVSSANVSAFKNFPLGARRKLQLRLEAYNVLNHTQIRDVGRTITFQMNPAQPGFREQTAASKATFGLATADSRPPRILQASVRLSF
jgi:hypothetical protein